MKHGRKTVCSFLLAAVFLMTVRPVLAHHGSAVSYDTRLSVAITMTGTVTEVRWRNPHVFIMYEVNDDKGGTVLWSAETSSPTSMIGEHGWTRRTVNPGDVLTMTVLPSRVAGAPAGLLYKLVAADGKVLLQDESRLRNGREADK